MNLIDINELLFSYYDNTNQSDLVKVLKEYNINLHLLEVMKVCFPKNKRKKDYYISQLGKMKDMRISLHLETVYKRISLTSNDTINVFPLILDSDYKFGIEKMKGILGFTSYNNIFIVMNLNQVNAKDTIENIFIHEYCHAYRNTYINKDLTNIRDLQFYIVEEGLAEYYVQEVKGINSIGEWAKNIDILGLKENTHFYTNYKDTFDSAMIQKILFGSERIGCPHWFGYSFGYKLIEYFNGYRGIDFYKLIRKEINYFNIKIEEFNKFLLQSRSRI